MFRVERLAALILLAGPLPLAAAGDTDKIREAIRGVVVRENGGQPAPTANSGSFSRQVADQVINTATTAPKPRRDHGGDYWRERRGYDRGALYCLSFLECPLGAYGAPTFDELRHHYRNYSDSEMWDMCLGRSAAVFAYGRDGACMLVASPHPWRPVDLPHNLEHGDIPPVEDSPGQSSDEGENCKVRVVTAAAVNETLNRKRPPRDCPAKSTTAG